MNRIGNAFLLAFFLGLVGALIAPGVFFGLRLAETWTTEYTAQLLGGALGICGAGVALVGVLVGAGLFARLAGWRALRRKPEIMPPRTINGQWAEPPRAAPQLSEAPPPWGVTGGGIYDLLPAPPEQDPRFSIDAPANERAVGGQR